MVATDRSGVRLAGLAALVVVVGVAVLVGLDRSGSSSLGALPPTSRDDVSLTVDAERRDELVRLSFVVEVDAEADEPLLLNDFSGGERPPTPGDDPSAPPSVPKLSTAVNGDRQSDGTLVFHLGGPSIVGGGTTDFQEPPQSQERRVRPGESVEGGAAFSVSMAITLAGHTEIRAHDLAQADVVRVCLWAAGVSPAPDARPVACADDDL